MNKQAIFLSIIVPVYNEEQAIPLFLERMNALLPTLCSQWEYIFVDDGSEDATLEILKKCAAKDKSVKIVEFSRNFGKEAALTAGLRHSSGDAVIPMDVDLQDPPELIAEMIEKWQEGYDVVLATRKARQGDSFLKRNLALLFYKMIRKTSNIDIPYNTGDYRLMSRDVVQALGKMNERTRFMKGIFAWAGFKTTQVVYDRPARSAGESHQRFKNLWKLALDGIFSFTTLPLRIWTYIGLCISGIAFIYALVIIFRTLIMGIEVPGYASLMTVVLFMGGIQLVSLGVIGEYISRIYRETKQRPLYIVRTKTGFDDE